MIRSSFFLFCLLFGISACQQTPTTIETTATIVPNVDKAKAAHLETAIGQVPIYSSFEELAPIFERKDDKTYVINFWATWCKPCVKELPHFEELQTAYAAQNVEVILVSLDFERQLKKQLKPFLEERKLQSEVMILTDGQYNNWIDRVDPEWGGAIPATVVYNAQKRTFVQESFATYADLEAVLLSILKA